jgi:hypothetical protein
MSIPQSSFWKALITMLLGICGLLMGAQAQIGVRAKSWFRYNLTNRCIELKN